MLSPDKGTRNLLPILDEEPDEIVLPAAEDGGAAGQAVATDIRDTPSSHHDINPPTLNFDLVAGESNAKLHSDTSGMLDPSGAAVAARAGRPFDASEKLDPIDAGGGSGHGHHSSSPAQASSPPPSGTALPSQGHDGSDGNTPSSSTPNEDPSTGTDHSGNPVSSLTPGDIPLPGLGLPIGTPGQAPIPLAIPDGDDLHIIQTAFVDQDAEVLLNGWTGDSKIRVFMENDADMDQDVDINIDYDGTGRMFLRLNQFMAINQETDVDLDIYEVKGILYVDLHLRNEVDVEQDTELDLMMGDWKGSSLVHASNDLDVTQHTDVDVDIDDDLEEQFKIKVAVGIRQAIHTDQDADIDLTYANGGFGIDLDAVQTAMIDQDTTLKIDFSVI